MCADLVAGAMEAARHRIGEVVESEASLRRKYMALLRVVDQYRALYGPVPSDTR